MKNSMYAILVFAMVSGCVGSESSSDSLGEVSQPTTPAPAGKITASFSCSARVSLCANWPCPVQQGTPNVAYTADVYGNGNVFAQAEVDGPEFGISKSVEYAPSQTGATNAAVDLVDDFVGTENSGFWTFSLNRTTKEVNATYVDVDLGGSGSASWLIPCTKISY